MPATSSVYVVEASPGLIKVGFSSDPAARLVSLQTGSPHPLRLAYSVGVAGDAFAVEQEAHAILSKHHHAGEWFTAPVEAGIAAIHAAAYRLGIPIGDAAHGYSVPKGRRWGWWKRTAFCTALFLPLPLLAVLDPYKAGGLIFAAYAVVTGIMINLWCLFRTSMRPTWRGVGQWLLALVPAFPLATVLAFVLAALIQLWTKR